MITILKELTIAQVCSENGWTLVTVRQKLAMLLENKALQKLKLSKNFFYKKCCGSKQLFLIEITDYEHPMKA